jgi:hypothetical protein
MTIQELFELAIQGLGAPIPGVSLTIPRGKYPRHFPPGELLQEKQDGTRVYSFDPGTILGWMMQGGFVKAIRRGENIVEFELIGEGDQRPPETTQEADPESNEGSEREFERTPHGSILATRSS